MNNNEVKILVDGEQLDLMENTDLKLSKNFTGTEESFSYDFEIPATTNNQRILGFLGKLHVANKFLNNLSATLYVNDTELFTGNLYVDSANSSTYSCNLIGAKFIEVSELLSDDYDKPLNELKPDPYKHFLINPIKYIPTRGPYNVKGRVYSGFNAEFINSYNSDVEDKDLGYTYPLALYGKPFLYLTGESDDDFNVNTEDFFKNRLVEANDSRKQVKVVSDAPGHIFPFFNIVDIVKAIFYDRLGDDVKFEGNFFNSPIFKSLYQSFQGTYKDYYERDNQRFKVSLSMNYNTIIQDSSILPTYGTEIFNWGESEDDEGISFLSTNIIKAQSSSEFGFIPKFKVDTKNCPNGIVNPIDYDSEGIVSGISIKKSGWYKIHTDVELSYTPRRNYVYSHYLNSNKFRSCCGNIFNQRLYPTAEDPWNTLDAVSLYTNIWEFQIVKKDSTSNIYSDFRNQKYIQNPNYINYINIPKRIDINGNRFSVTGILRASAPNIYKTRYPKNSHTFFVNGEDLLCGFRVGNQYSCVDLYNTYYDALREYLYLKIYHTDTSDFYGKINRSKVGNYLNIPLFGTTSQTGVSEWRYNPTSHRAEMFDADIIGNSEGLLVDLVDFTNRRIYDSGDSPIERFGLYGGQSLTRTYSYLTNINLLRSDKSFSQSNYNTKLTNYNMGLDVLNHSIVSYNDSNYKNNVELGFNDNQVINTNYCSTPFATDFYTPVENDGESVHIQSDNLVYLKQDDEYDIRLISPVINISPICGYENLQGKQLPVNFSIDIKELSFEYIGENNDAFVPGDDNLVNNSEETNTTFPTYFTQYLDDTKSSDWIENLAKLFKLQIKIDSVSKSVTIDYNSKDNFIIVDLSDYVNLDNIKSNNPITFTELEKPKSIIINWNREGVEENRELEKGWDIVLDKAVSPFNYYKDREFNIKGGVLNLNGKEEPEIIDTSYGFPEAAVIRLNSEISDYTYNIPLVTSYNDWHNTYLNTSDSYVANGLDNSRLYFSESINNGQSLGIRLLKNYDQDFRLPLMTTEKFGIDLKNLNTIIENFYNVDSSSEYIELQAFLPYRIYNSLSRDVLVKIDNSLFKLAKIDEYNVTGDKSCKLTVSPLG